MNSYETLCNRYGVDSIWILPMTLAGTKDQGGPVNFLCNILPTKERGGKYYAGAGNPPKIQNGLVLFQHTVSPYPTGIIGCGIVTDYGEEPHMDNGTWQRYYQFAMDSIRVFQEPVFRSKVQKIVPEASMTRAQRIDYSYLRKLCEMIDDQEYMDLDYGVDRLGSISIEDSPEFDRIYEAINACTGRNLKGYQLATYHINSGYRLWFPKLPMRKDGRLVPWSTVKSWINELSPDGKQIRMYSHEEPVILDPLREECSLWITFAKAAPDKPYRYIGTFTPDLQHSSSRELILVRVANRIDISGIDLK